MVKVGAIAIDLVAHTGKLLKPLKQAETAVMGLAGKFVKFGGIAAAITAPLAGLLSVHTAINRVKTALQELDDVGKASDRLGIATEELIGLRHAAELAGVSANDLQTALQYMLKKGFSVSDLGRLADQMVSITDPMERMQWIIERFGRSGAGMINVLAGGSAGLDAMRRDAEKLGLVFSRMDAGKVEAANDAFARIGLAMNGLARTMAVQLAPYIENLSNRLVDFVTNSELGLREKIPEAVEWCTTKIGELGDTIGWMGKQWKIAEFGVAAFSAALDAALLQADANLKELGNFIVYMWDQKGIGTKVRKALGIETLSDVMTGGKPSRSKILEPYDKFGAAQAQQRLQDFVLESGETLERWASRLATDKPAINRRRRGAGGTDWQVRTPGMAVDDIAEKLTDAVKSSSVSMAGALEMGSVAAMSAISQTRRPIEEQQLQELKDIAINTDRLLDDAVLLRRANLA